MLDTKSKSKNRVGVTTVTKCQHLLQFRDGVAAGFPLVSATLTLVHHVAFDWCTSIILWWFPGQEDALGALITPLQVLGRIRYSYKKKDTGEKCS